MGRSVFVGYKDDYAPVYSIEDIERKIDYEIQLEILKKKLKEMPHVYAKAWYLIYQKELPERKVAIILRASRWMVRKIKNHLKRILSRPSF